MKNLAFALLFGFFFFVSSTFAQNAQPTPVNDEDDVVKITTKLVQLDAVVTDKDGKQIKDLSIDDFELLQDGKPQKITDFSYVNTETSGRVSAQNTIKNGRNVSAPPVRVNPQSSGRIVTFIVDDGNCTASLIGMTASREALGKFVNDQMMPNDLVAIYRTRGGSSLLQQYTSDKAQLMRVVRQIRWYPPSGNCVSYNGDFFAPTRDDSTGKVSGQGTFKTEATLKNEQRDEDSMRDNQTVGTLGVISYVVRGLEKIGGRKVVFLLSDGIPVRTRENDSRLAFYALRDLTDAANRASVVFNTIDVRGLISYSPQGNDVRGDAVEERIKEVRMTRDGLLHLAEETGGSFYKDQNFLDNPIRQALSLEKGYYLIGYVPENETFKNKDFNKIEIKLKRPDLKVNSRSGFLAKTDESVAPKKRSGDSELYEAIIAPLPRAGLNVRLAAYFVNDAAQGNVVRSLVHLDGSQLNFVDDANGMKKLSLDVVAVTLNEKNAVVDEFNRTHNLKIEAAAIPFIKQNGIVYTTDVPVKKAGNYNFRLAVRDANSKMLGSSGQMIQIPDLKKSDIFISGLIVSATDASGKFAIPTAVKPENALSATNSAAVPAIRRFRPGTVLAYAYRLYNPQIDKATNQPKLTVQINLYRDGQIVVEGSPQAAQLEKSADQTRIDDYGYMKLNAGAEKGDYALQVIVKDLLANKTTSQWIDFEVE